MEGGIELQNSFERNNRPLAFRNARNRAAEKNFVGYFEARVYRGKMQSKSDTELLREYAERGTEAAFTELVNRHTNLVYSAAVRQVDSPDTAAEVAQSVFLSLAQKARSTSLRLAGDASLAGWLCRSARNISLNHRRNEFRRHSRERQAMEQLDPIAETAPDWERLRPVLDEAMSELKEADYDALVMRFFNNQDLRSIAQALGVADDTAQKRVSRALDKLRERLARRGISATAAALSTVLSANAVQTAPAGLAVKISAAAALTGTTVQTSTAFTVTKVIAMSTLQKAVIGVAFAAAVGMGVHEARQAARLRNQVETLQQEQAPLAGQLAQLRTENAVLSSEVVQVRSSPALSEALFSELLKLRGQATLAGADTRELARLKSMPEPQSGKTPDFMSNAMATAMEANAEWQLRDAQARLALMQKVLKLTTDQARAIGDILTNQIHKQSQIALEAMSGKLTPEQQAALVREPGVQEADIKAMLTPAQLAAYPDYLQTEKTTGANTSARSEAGQIARDFSLSDTQQEQIYAALYQMSLSKLAGGPQPEVIAAAARSGNLADMAKMVLDQQTSQLEEKLKVLAGFLTPEQISIYREKQSTRIDAQVAALNRAAKRIQPPNTSGTPN